MKDLIGKSVRSGFVIIFALALIGISGLQVWGAPEDYYGTYAGTFSGDDSGYWIAAITASPVYGSEDGAFLTYSTTSDTGDGGYIYSNGESGGVGYYFSYPFFNDTTINVQIGSTDGSVDGTWENYYLSEGGSVSGGAITECDFAGTYSGSLNGSASGSWTMTIDNDCYIAGEATIEGGLTDFEGAAHPQGYVLAAGTVVGGGSFVFTGEISGTLISGSWESTDGGAGSFHTASSDSGDSGSGSGGGGGCFIHALSGQ